MNVIIIPYQTVYEDQIEELKSYIYEEFSLPRAYSGLQTAVPHAYWIALYQNEVIGSVGINLVNSSAILKRMFLKREYRGDEKGVSGALLKIAVDWCRKKNKTQIFLGTMQQFKRAQKFYEKNGFELITADQLPVDFENNPVDSIFYKLVI